MSLSTRNFGNDWFSKVTSTHSFCLWRSHSKIFLLASRKQRMSSVAGTCLLVTFFVGFIQLTFSNFPIWKNPLFPINQFQPYWLRMLEYMTKVRADGPLGHDFALRRFVVVVVRCVMNQRLNPFNVPIKITSDARHMARYWTIQVDMRRLRLCCFFDHTFKLND